MRRHPVEIRWAFPHDSRDIHALEAVVFGRNHGTLEQLRAFLDTRGNAALVACRRKLLVGYLVYTLDLHARLLEITNLAVDEAERRRGIASQLLNHLLTRAGRVRGVRMAATCSEYNVPMQKLLRKHGFRCIQTLSEAAKGVDAYVFERPGVDSEQTRCATG